MKLIHDEYNDWWIWVEEKNHEIELSPPFDFEEDARLWKTRMINILVKKQNDIQQS